MRASTRFARPASRSGCQVRDADPARSPRPAVPSLADPPDPPRSTQTRLRVLHLLDEAYISGAREVREPPGRARFSNLGTPHPRRGLSRSLEAPSPPLFPPPPLTPLNPFTPQPPPILSQVHLDRIAAGLFAPRDPGDPVAAAAAARLERLSVAATRMAFREPESSRRWLAEQEAILHAARARLGEVPVPPPPPHPTTADEPGSKPPARRTPPPPPPPPSGHRWIAFERAPRAIARRDVVLRRGLALVPDALMPEVMAHDHRAATLRALSATAARAEAKTAARGAPRPRSAPPRSPASSARSPCGARRGRARTARGPTSKKTNSESAAAPPAACVMRGVVFPARGTRRGGTPTRRGSRGLTRPPPRRRVASGGAAAGGNARGATKTRRPRAA